MAATINAVQPSLCLALTSAPSDNNLKKGKRNILSIWHIMDMSRNNHRRNDSQQTWRLTDSGNRGLSEINPQSQ
jgi:hypothetical protein